MNKRDTLLFARLRDLESSIGEDIDWLAGTLRADGINDLGERLTDLGTDLIRRATELNATETVGLPGHRWVPAAGTVPGRTRLAHHLGDWPIRCGVVYLAVCGAACYPFYGRDTADRITRHDRCAACDRWSTPLT